jgi:Clp amino terminal domain, pathogenicity island component
MSQASDRVLSPTPHHYGIMGRAAEIARGLGSRVGAEHLFLGMLHDGGWPVNVMSSLVDPGEVEAAVLDILNSPGYSPPPPPPPYSMRDGYVRPWGAEVALEMGDSYIGVEHALLAMIRNRETVPARALAGLTDLDALEAAVLEVKNAPAGGPGEDAVFLPAGQEMDGPLRRAIAGALPEDTTFGFNSDADERTWMRVISPGDVSDPVLTREVLNAALTSLKRPALDG